MATMFDLLDGNTACTVAEMIGRGSRYHYGGYEVSYMVKRGMSDTKDTREQATREIAEIQLGWLERLGGIRIEGDKAFLVNRTIEIPNVNGERWSLDDTRPYTLGQSRRENNERTLRIDLLEAWNEVLFNGARSRKVNGTTWTKKSILATIEEARGPVDQTAILLLASSMALIDYDVAYPLLVTEIGGEEYTVDGRHRKLAAAERELQPTKVKRQYSKVEDLLGAIIRSDETRRGWNPEQAASAWAAVGLSLETIRHWAGTDLRDAEYKRLLLQAEAKAAQRGRRSEGTSRKPGRPPKPEVAAKAEEIVQRQAKGERVNVAAEAREIGVGDSTLRKAVKSEKPDMSSFSDSSTPKPEPTPQNGDLTCHLCGASGPMTDGVWAQRISDGYVPMRKQGGGNQVIAPKKIPNQFAHIGCAKPRTKGIR
jgi:hypothetical protein